MHAAAPDPSGAAPIARSAAEALSRTLRVVADPTRLQVLSSILGSSQQRATVGQLAEMLDLTQPTVTHHVRILVDDGVLVRHPEGKFVWLSVAPDRITSIEDLLR
ncbi:ArsR/SmtB family transcription factor [Microbacterium koreense]|uniref:ArsR/SmtB family transcription factor n=1 Tax=Microbacterium koreense TaxID=323761 RepID=A0ABW2ZRA1_9MICO